MCWGNTTYGVKCGFRLSWFHISAWNSTKATLEKAALPAVNHWILFLCFCLQQFPVTRSVCLPSLVTALWWLRLKNFHWRTILLSLLYFRWKHVGREGMGGSGRGPPVSRLPLPHPVSSLFPGYLLRQGPDQHCIPPSSPLDNFLFSWLYFWTFWELVSLWDLLITKGPGFDDHSTFSRSSWMLNRDICTALKWTGVLIGYKAVTPCGWAVLNMYFRQLFSPALLFCSAILPLRERKLF